MILQLLLLLSWDNVQFICFISIYSLNFCAALQGLAAWVVTLLNFTLCDLGVICKRYHNLMISELEPWKLRRIEGWSQHTSDQTPLGLPFGVSLTERQHEGCSLNLSVNWDLNDWGGRWGLQEKQRNLLDGAGWGGKTISVWPMSALPMTLVWRVQEPSLGSCWTCPCTCLALLWLSSLLSQPGKAPQPNLSHMPWDGGEVPCSERNSHTTHEGRAGLTCLNKIKENISEGISRKPLLLQGCGLRGQLMSLTGSSYLWGKTSSDKIWIYSELQSFVAHPWFRLRTHTGGTRSTRVCTHLSQVILSRGDAAVHFADPVPHRFLKMPTNPQCGSA